MKVVWGVVAAIFVLVGVTTWGVFERSRARALETVGLLQPYPATIEKVERCRSRSVCYETVVRYTADGALRRSRVAGKHGKAGDALTIWTKPAYYKAYVSPASYLKLSSQGWIPVLYLEGVMAVMLLLAIYAGTTRMQAEPQHEGAAGRQAGGAG